MKAKILLLLFLTFPLMSCRLDNNNEVSITFLQHTYISTVEKIPNQVYYKFENDILTKNTLKFEKGYQITAEDIYKFQKQIHYKVPPLKYGYYRITDYAYNYDSLTKIASNIFKPTKLDKSITLHFAVYG